MTPRVAKAVSEMWRFGVETEEFVWFDVEDAPIDEIATSFVREPELFLHLPFTRVALVMASPEGNVIPVLVGLDIDPEEREHLEEIIRERAGDRAVKDVLAFGFQIPIPSNGRNVSGMVGVAEFEDGKKSSYLFGVDASGRPLDPERLSKDYANLINAALVSLRAATASNPRAGHVPKMHPSGHKRIAQGRPPTYEWTTVELAPPTPRTEHQGGTHASPRQHLRRGHWRTYRSGKRVWIRDMVVGKGSNGAVFHDYVAKPQYAR